jgi:hypothetical protein
MAQRTHVEMVDDIDGGVASQTVSFGLDGVSYEIDLSDKNAEALRSELERFVTAGRRTGGRKVRTARGGPAATGGTSSTSSRSREYNQQVRAWAAANGRELADRGRIPADVFAAFEAQNSEPVELESSPVEPEPEAAAKPGRKRAPRRRKTEAA